MKMARVLVSPMEPCSRPTKAFHQVRPLAVDLLHATGGGHGQRSGTGVAVHRGPHHVAGHIRRVGEEQESTTNQGRVEEVLAGAAEHFLADHHAES